MMKEWMVNVTQVEFVIADSEEEAIKEAKKLCLGLGSDARYDATEIKSRYSDETADKVK